MVEIALREAGWRAESLGSGHPAETLCAAIRKESPRLFWVSVSAFSSSETLVADCDQLYETAVSHDAALVLGGRALSEEIRRKIRYSAYCDTLDHLVSFARTLMPAASQAEARTPTEGTSA
jgi:methanogenic corrinoid protein MtbC1